MGGVVGHPKRISRKHRLRAGLPILTYDRNRTVTGLNGVQVPETNSRECETGASPNLPPVTPEAREVEQPSGRALRSRGLSGEGLPLDDGQPGSVTARESLRSSHIAHRVHEDLRLATRPPQRYN